MTDQAATELIRRDETRKTDPVDVAHPLSMHLKGVLTVHFERGATVARPVSQFEARSFLNKQRDTESGDEVTWEVRHWFTWADERVVFSSFDADSDQNWDISPEDRRALLDASHGRGVIDSLMRFWETRDPAAEPRYSIRAIVSLHDLAVGGADQRTWEAAARHFEGRAGARRLAKIWEKSDGQTPPMPAGAEDQLNGFVDDDVEPDSAVASDVEGGGTVDDVSAAADPHGGEDPAVEDSGLGDPPDDPGSGASA